MEPYVYTPLTKPNAIRLLKLQEGAEGDVIECDVEEVSLDDSPQYEALSYTWNTDIPIHLTTKPPPQNSNTGPPEPLTRPIKCGGRLLTVQLNLYYALEQFRRKPRQVPLWVDSICIDQKDNAHKAEQIALMGRIYSTAQHVVIWLGPTSTGQDLAFKVISRLRPTVSSEKTHDLSTTASDVASLRDATFHKKYATPLVDLTENKDKDPVEGNPAADKGEDTSKSNEAAPMTLSDSYADALAVMRILRRGWFSRTWTLQELLLAREVVICIGERELTPEAVVNAAQWVLQFYANDMWLRQVNREIVFAHYKHLIAIPAFFKSREQFKAGKRWSLEEYATVARTRAVTVADDKVHASYALIDYPLPLTSGSTIDVFLNFAKALYSSKESGIHGLSLVGDVLSSIANLPSWVPDLTIMLNPRPLRYEHEGRFKAATTAADIQNCIIEGPTLTFQGAEWDTIESIGESQYTWHVNLWSSYAYRDAPNKARFLPDTHVERFGTMLPIVTALGTTYKPTGEPTIAALCHSLLAGKYAGKPLPSLVQQSFCYAMSAHIHLLLRFAKYPAGYLVKFMTLDRKTPTHAEDAVEPLLRDALEHALEDRWTPFVNAFTCEAYPLKDVSDFVEKGVDKNTTWTGFLDNVYKAMFKGHNMESSINPFAALVEETYDRRRLFVTKKGYIGVGFESLTVGDKVILPAGADAPYVFRPVAGRDGAYNLIGEAYVHGIMEGEALKNEKLDFKSVIVL